MSQESRLATIFSFLFWAFAQTQQLCHLVAIRCVAPTGSDNGCGGLLRLTLTQRLVKWELKRIYSFIYLFPIKVLNTYVKWTWEFYSMQSKISKVLYHLNTFVLPFGQKKDQTDISQLTSHFSEIYANCISIQKHRRRIRCWIVSIWPSNVKLSS